MKPEVLHLYVTNKCTNNCPLCCNKNYDFINGVKQVTEEELSSVHTVCLTGGDPFLLINELDFIVDCLRARENIKRIYIFTSGYACLVYLKTWGKLPRINGITFSPKSDRDWDAINDLINDYNCVISELDSNRLYAFIEKYDDCNYSIDNNLLYTINYAHEDLDCQVFFRMWSTEFNSPETEIFRKL